MDNTVVKTFKTKVGLDALILLIRGDHHCGYVGFDKDHILYNVGYQDLEEIIEVHGGLTFSGKQEEFKDQWWLGFDCAHYGDRCLMPEVPSAMKRLLHGNVFRDSVFRDAEYVEKQCENLAYQLSKVKQIKTLDDVSYAINILPFSK